MILNGKELAASLKSRIEHRVNELNEIDVQPCLAMILVAGDEGSAYYVQSKSRQLQQFGLKAVVHTLPADVAESRLYTLIEAMNRDPSVHGILMQLPLPQGINSERLIEVIDPRKDVDGLHPVSLGRLLNGAPTFVPCTPLGCLMLIHSHRKLLRGETALVVGRSNLVGKPMAILLQQQDCTVIQAHSHTPCLESLTAQADILVSATGQAALIKGNWIKPGAIVIDVGLSRGVDKKLTGDVEFPAASQRAEAITPVPGGVGPMTIACLLYNTLKACCQQLNLAFSIDPER